MSPAPTTRRSASRCSAATSGAVTTTIRPAASGTRTTAGVPAFVTIQAPVSGWQNNLNYNLGIYAQDRWTMNRLTLSGGVRLDFQNESTEPFTAGPHKWLPNRNITFAAVKNVPNWKDINPRVSAAYDLFGNGKTAIKASVSRGVEQDSIRYARRQQPGVHDHHADRTAPGPTANRNFVPDCNLTIGDVERRVRPVARRRPSARPCRDTVYSPAIMEGWGVRPYNWEFSTSVQQQIAPRVSLNVRLLPPHQRQLLRARQRGARPERLHAVLGEGAHDRRQRLHAAELRGRRSAASTIRTSSSLPRTS